MLMACCYGVLGEVDADGLLLGLAVFPADTGHCAGGRHRQPLRLHPHRAPGGPVLLHPSLLPLHLP